MQSAANLLFAIGILSAVAGGFQGLASRAPGVVVAAFVLLLGYGIAGYLLLSQGTRAVRVAGPLTLVLVFLTLWWVPAWVAQWDAFSTFVFLPTLTVLLAMATGGFLAAWWSASLPQVAWPGRRNETAAGLLQLASFPPVWGAYLSMAAIGGFGSGSGGLLLVVMSFVAASAGFAAAQVAHAGRHPSYVLGGAILAFVANVVYVFDFLGNPYGTEAVQLGALVSLLGMLASGFPIALAIVTWYAGEQVSPAAP